ncbi:type I restriction endonuclease subunit R [Lactobacillus terrae]|uniref:type I restriction endonuclease subunit R n=1 Tax=Lactobacillus terrae TaxID=2269374 RepID=UPI000C1B616B|nr:HsdR family type I site-specific deoxyribonuclease [Lactobacillus terrae]
MAVEKRELEFENKIVEYLTKIGGTKQWQEMPDIKNTDQLWVNFKTILENNNPDKLKKPLSVSEFNQVKSEISNLSTSFKAGQFLYGLNGTSQVEVDLDDGRHVFLTVFDQAQVGAGNTTYQIVKQIERDPIVAGKKSRRFDITLLINGLPIIQIEEKADGHDAKEALNQMHQYIAEKQYSDIFSTLQILVAMTPHDARYMANTSSDMFNTDFAFRWQDEKTNAPILDWKEFANKFLSIPMAHQMATSYMILNGTKNRQMIMSMRSYQVYATRRVIERISNHHFGEDPKELGYVWHTTGSGKTISSFKAAWLASRLPNVDKVVFLVDRVALTNQTVEEYQAYDPDSDDLNKNGVVDDTANKSELEKKLLSDGSGIIVTSTQKMGGLAESNKLKNLDKNIVFIVDEAHRSTSGDMMLRIKDSIKRSAFVGYTGTPAFDPKEGPTTQELFGDLLHAYTIRDAIADKNVLGFKVDFETTLSDQSLKENYLPRYFKYQHPEWTAEQIDHKINNMTAADMDDQVTPSVYDMNEDHVKEVVSEIIRNWNKRSNSYKYNAILTTKVGGGKASTPMAMMYYDEFKRQNKTLEKPLKVGVTFSRKTDNSDSQLETNENLDRAMQEYNEEFGTNFDATQDKEYNEDLATRLNKKAVDGNYLDLVIVVDRLLTGFNAPQLNTLYVDRTLKGAGLIQAYSRTNRVQNMQEKPFGHIVNYRWPHNSEKLMDEALQLYANRESANYQLVVGDLKNDPEKGVLESSYTELVDELKEVVADISEATSNFVMVPPSETLQETTYDNLEKYNRIMAKIKQDENYDEEHPEKLLESLGMTEDDEAKVTGVFAEELKKVVAENHDVDLSDLTLTMEHVKDVKVNYDYLNILIAELANQVKDGDNSEAEKTRDKIVKFADQLEDSKYAKQVSDYAEDIYNKEVEFEKYPVNSTEIPDLLDNYATDTMRKSILEFKRKWGLVDIKNVHLINEILENHVVGADDLNVSGERDQILKEGQVLYQEDSTDPEIRELSKIKYRNSFKEAFNKFADTLKRKY